MCGRIAITLPNDAMVRLFAAVPANDLPPVPNYNVCPTTGIHVVMQDGYDRRLVRMRWGFIPHWYKEANGGPLLINARAETIAEKPAFRAACQERRCLIPISDFYEWTRLEDGTKLPWYIHADAPLALAGIWQDWSAKDDAREATLRTCAVVTTAANTPMADIHHRMPVIVPEDKWALWLGEEGHGAARLMQSAPDDLLSFYRVDPKVNSNRASGPELIEPI